MIYELPRSLFVNGKEHPIRTDFRDIMRIIYAMNDPDLENNEKVYVCLYVMYEDFDELDQNDYQEAFKQANEFIDYGTSGGNTHGSSNKPVIDFEQDERLLISAINRVAGREVRSMEYLHWWTFMGYFYEIGECTYSTILSIRSKKVKGKKLEKWETEFWDANKNLCVIKEKLSEEDKADYEEILKLLS